MTGTGLSRAGIGHIALAIKRFREDAPYKAPDCAEEEEGDAEASATDDDKAAGVLNKHISETCVAGVINQGNPEGRIALMVKTF